MTHKVKSRSSHGTFPLKNTRELHTIHTRVGFVWRTILLSHLLKLLRYGLWIKIDPIVCEGDEQW